MYKTNIFYLQIIKDITLVVNIIFDKLLVVINL